jgi:hypothetical protein
MPECHNILALYLEALQVLLRFAQFLLPMKESVPGLIFFQSADPKYLF